MGTCAAETPCVLPEGAADFIACRGQGELKKKKRPLPVSAGHNNNNNKKY